MQLKAKSIKSLLSNKCWEFSCVKITIKALISDSLRIYFIVCSSLAASEFSEGILSIEITSRRFLAEDASLIGLLIFKASWLKDIIWLFFLVSIRRRLELMRASLRIYTFVYPFSISTCWESEGYCLLWWTDELCIELLVVTYKWLISCFTVECDICDWLFNSSYAKLFGYIRDFYYERSSIPIICEPSYLSYTDKFDWDKFLLAFYTDKRCLDTSLFDNEFWCWSSSVLIKPWDKGKVMLPWVKLSSEVKGRSELIPFCKCSCCFKDECCEEAS